MLMALYESEKSEQESEKWMDFPEGTCDGSKEFKVILN